MKSLTLPAIDFDHPINRGLVFGWDGRKQLLNLAGTGGVASISSDIVRAASRDNEIGSRIGNTSSSAISFTTGVETNDLHYSPISCLVYTKVIDAYAYAVIGRGTTSTGWHIGSRVVVMCRPSSHIIAQYTTSYPTVGFHTYVVTYDGGELASGISTYFDGVSRSQSSSQNGSGTAVSVTSGTVDIGRMQATQTTNWEFYNIRIVRRVITQEEINAFAKNPYIGFKRDSGYVVYSLIGFPPPAGSVTSYAHSAVVYRQSSSNGILVSGQSASSKVDRQIPSDLMSVNVIESSIKRSLIVSNNQSSQSTLVSVGSSQSSRILESNAVSIRGLISSIQTRSKLGTISSDIDVAITSAYRRLIANSSQSNIVSSISSSINNHIVGPFAVGSVSQISISCSSSFRTRMIGTIATEVVPQVGFLISSSVRRRAVGSFTVGMSSVSSLASTVRFVSLPSPIVSTPQYEHIFFVGHIDGYSSLTARLNVDGLELGPSRLNARSRVQSALTEISIVGNVELKTNPKIITTKK